MNGKTGIFFSFFPSSLGCFNCCYIHICYLTFILNCVYKDSRLFLVLRSGLSIMKYPFIFFHSCIMDEKKYVWEVRQIFSILSSLPCQFHLLLYTDLLFIFYITMYMRVVAPFFFIIRDSAWLYKLKGPIQVTFNSITLLIFFLSWMNKFMNGGQTIFIFHCLRPPLRPHLLLYAYFVMEYL